MKVKCDNCATEFEGQRKTVRFCSDLCRVQFNRKRTIVVPTPIAQKIIDKHKEGFPPAGLTGIDLAIWKAEQKAKTS
jgi:endogenous inhibitor of DNA gyrase (YacG/DUF329 family)